MPNMVGTRMFAGSLSIPLVRRTNLSHELLGRVINIDRVVDESRTIHEKIITVSEQKLGEEFEDE